MNDVTSLLRDPVTALIVVCEVGFWVALAAGLAVRYGLRQRRLSPGWAGTRWCW
jgi:hypothetical protein